MRERLRPYRRLVWAGLACLAVVDLLESVPPLLLKSTVDLVSQPGDPTRRLLTLAAAYLGVSIIQAVGRYGWRMYLIRASFLAGRDIRELYTRHLFKLSASFFDRSKIGDLMSVATNDVDAIRMALGPGLLVLADAFILFVSTIAVMFWLSPPLALLSLVPLPLIPWIVMRNEKEIHSRFLAVQESFGRLSALAQEGLSGIRVVKAFAREHAQLDRFRAAGQEYVSLNLALSRVQSAFGPTLDFAMSVGMVLLLWIGGQWTLDHAVTIGTFVAFQRYIQKMVWPMAAFGMAINYYQRAVASSDRIRELLAIRTDVPEPDTPSLPTTFDRAASRTPGRIEFRHLTFRYPGGATPILKDINLTIEAGERVAFVGAIGAGKSALLSLLPRLYPVERGMLFVDGVDVNDWPLDELRRQVGFVSQDVFLFSGTVEENLSFGPQAIPPETAARAAAIHDDVLRMTEAYSTKVGERGSNLSGGQKQRLSIARALAIQPAILVLDDALSSVDVQTEERILAALRSRPGRNTEVIAAHRISTVKEADRIVVIEAGAIRQVGAHTELVRDRRGSYRRFYEQQTLKEDLEHYHVP